MEHLKEQIHEERVSELDNVTLLSPLCLSVSPPCTMRLTTCRGQGERTVLPPATVLEMLFDPLKTGT